MAPFFRTSDQRAPRPDAPTPDSARRRWPRSSPIQRAASTFSGLARMAIWRIRYYSGLSLLALLGVIIAVGLVTSAAFFAQTVDQVIMDRELAEYSRITQRPPFSARVFAPSSQAVPFDLARVES